MADIGRILYLPPPLQPAAAPSSAALSSAAPGRNLASAPGDTPRGETAMRGVVAAIDGDPGASAGGRAKQFRFRVYDGSRPEEALAGDNGLPTRRTSTSRSGAASGETTTRGPAGLDARSGEAARGGTGTGLATPSSAFLAQLIAQEQLRPGLHDPPLRDADLAYRRAGGEPALGGDAGGPFRARFKLAV